MERIEIPPFFCCIADYFFLISQKNHQSAVTTCSPFSQAHKVRELEWTYAGT